MVKLERTFKMFVAAFIDDGALVEFLALMKDIDEIARIITEYFDIEDHAVSQVVGALAAAYVDGVQNGEFIQEPVEQHFSISYQTLEINADYGSFHLRTVRAQDEEYQVVMNVPKSWLKEHVIAWLEEHRWQVIYQS